eukprot:3022097-Alexandrium_andersonii.AAC.1
MTPWPGSCPISFAGAERTARAGLRGASRTSLRPRGTSPRRACRATVSRAASATPASPPAPSPP